MAEMLLINPRRRAKRATAKRRVVRRANPVAAAPKRKVHRRRNPIGLGRVAHAVKRRRNPISLGGGAKGIMRQLQGAFVGGAGSVAVDVIMGQVNGYLPASMQRTPGAIGVGDAVKMGITIALGRLLRKPTKGMSDELAAGALTVQAAEIIRSVVPASMTMGGVGYGSPARIVQGTNRVTPNMGAYMPRAITGQQSPLLNAYARPGATQLLSGARERELYRK